MNNIKIITETSYRDARTLQVADRVTADLARASGSLSGASWAVSEALRNRRLYTGNDPFAGLANIEQEVIDALGTTRDVVVGIVRSLPTDEESAVRTEVLAKVVEAAFNNLIVKNGELFNENQTRRDTETALFESIKEAAVERYGDGVKSIYLTPVDGAQAFFEEGFGAPLQIEDARS